MKTNAVVKRGMVFWFTPPVVVGNTCVQQGNRLWLVTSNDTNNFVSSIVNLVPLTTESKAKLPVHVENIFINGKRNTILCEQPITTDTDRLSSYVTTLSDQVMAEVDKCIAIQQQLPVQFPLTYDRLFTAVDKLAEMQDQLTKKLEKADDLIVTLIQLLNKLEQISSVPQLNDTYIDELKNAVADASNFKVEKLSPASEKQIPEQQKTIPAANKEDKKQEVKRDVPTKPGRQTKWNIDNCVQLMIDCDTLPLDEVCKIWKLSMKSLFTTKYKAKQILREAGVDYEQYKKADKGTGSSCT